MNDHNYRNITLGQMEALLALVKEGSFSNAAQKMLVTQPALTKSIKNVEAALGVLVVKRTNAGVLLTPEGKILHAYAQRIVKLREEAKAKISSLQGNTGGDIYVGASTIPANYILPRALSEFCRTNPDIRVSVKTADSEEATTMVMDNEVEIGFIGRKPVDKRITAVPLWKDRLVLAVPRNHRWCKKQSITLADLTAEPFVVREKGSATRELFEEWLAKSRSANTAQLNIRCELGSSEAIKEAIIAGTGVSVLSVYAVERELAQGLLFAVPLQSCSLERVFYLIYKKQFDLRRFHKTFISFIKSNQLSYKVAK